MHSCCFLPSLCVINICISGLKEEVSPTETVGKHAERFKVKYFVILPWMSRPGDEILRSWTLAINVWKSSFLTERITCILHKIVSVTCLCFCVAGECWCWHHVQLTGVCWYRELIPFLLICKNLYLLWSCFHIESWHYSFKCVKFRFIMILFKR